MSKPWDSSHHDGHDGPKNVTSKSNARPRNSGPNSIAGSRDGNDASLRMVLRMRSTLGTRDMAAGHGVSGDTGGYLPRKSPVESSLPSQPRADRPVALALPAPSRITRLAMGMG